MTVSPRYLERTDHANGSSSPPPPPRPQSRSAGWTTGWNEKENCWLIRFRQIAARDLDSRRGSLQTKSSLVSYAASSLNPSLRFTVTVIPFVAFRSCRLFFFLEVAGYYYFLWASILYFSYFYSSFSKTQLEILVISCYINPLRSRRLFRTFRWISEPANSKRFHGRA